MAARRSPKAPDITRAPAPLTTAPEPSALTVPSVLATLSAGRLVDLCRLLGCDIREGTNAKDHLLARLARHLGARLPALLRELGRDELRAVCHRHGIDTSQARARAELQALILEAAGLDPRASSVWPTAENADGLPQKGQIVHARHRQWLVDDVAPGEGAESPLIRLVCLDDDDPGRRLDVLWDLEIGARLVAPEAHGLGEVARLDAPAHFGAYLHALKWSAVSAADATRFQAPFRAGIKLMAHQLTPLMKALELPRANLFIADDVGLGKTIEAGLVLQELILRQQASFVLIVCPASVCLQWQGEMLSRFGLRFEVMTRQFVAYRRQERGFGTNPWSTHNRFIVSHALLRRPEYRDPLLHLLGDRAHKGLLILDEAHVAAPASASKYATDTDITRAIRDLAPRFDNRLFLSATPHNGHSNSFSALLEILDPARFTRGISAGGPKELEPIMVRRLKRDLRKLGVERFPRRILVELSLTHREGTFHLAERRNDAETGEETTSPERPLSVPLSVAPARELLLGDKLKRYAALCAPASGQGRLPFIHLQQRLLSSPEAFARTLEAHAQGLAKKGGPVAAPQQQDLLAASRASPGSSTARPKDKDASDLTLDPETHGLSDEALAEENDALVRQASQALPSPTEEARALLAEMRALAEQARREPDGKVTALLAWMREHLCPALGLAPDDKPRASRTWSPRRVILFTEYADTKRYLVDLLTTAALATDDGERRILQFHGGMDDEARDEVQRAFNSAPEEHPVRILVATDAAREGVNLQAHCADLFHIDIPWNPSRMEQRNGRIDRTLQPAAEVRCHYFVYPQRAEDQVLATAVRKIATVQRDLGSLGAVLLGQIEKALEGGITDEARHALEKIGEKAAPGALDGKAEIAEAELEASRRDLDAVRAEVERAGRRLEASRRAFDVEPEALRGVVTVGLALAGTTALTEAGTTSDKRPTYTLPTLDRSWDTTLDTLRPPRGRTEAFWEWRNKPPRPVTFHPLASLSEGAEQLHLAHPFVRRILDRFLAQGFGAHDLSRVTAVVSPDASVVRVLGYARLTLFGAGAGRLHDQLVALAAAWSGAASEVKPYKDRATAVEAISAAERLLAGKGQAPNATLQKRIRDNAEALFRALWPYLEAEAEELAVEARRGLAERARREADDLRALLARQRVAIDKAEERLRQGDLFNIQDKEQKRQVDLDLRHLERRRAAAAGEIASGPAAIEALYEVRMVRLTPVGLAVVWPEAMT